MVTALFPVCNVLQQYTQPCVVYIICKSKVINTNNMYSLDIVAGVITDYANQLKYSTKGPGISFQQNLH